MPYEYNIKNELEQYIQEVQNMLVDVEDGMKLNNISWTGQMKLYLFRTYIVEKLSNLNNRLSNFQD